VSPLPPRCCSFLFRLIRFLIGSPPSYDDVFPTFPPYLCIFSIWWKPFFVKTLDVFWSRRSVHPGPFRPAFNPHVGFLPIKKVHTVDATREPQPSLFLLDGAFVSAFSLSPQTSSTPDFSPNTSAFSPLPKAIWFLIDPLRPTPHRRFFSFQKASFLAHSDAFSSMSRYFPAVLCLCFFLTLC